MARERWRLIADDGVSAAFGLAADEFLLQQPDGPDGDVTGTLRLYTYASHCALVGRFQDTATEVRLAECARLGVAVNRRPTGGGAILMGADQLGVALTLHAARADLPSLPGQLFQRLSAGVLAGLETLGVQARFRPKNDLEVDGRKIAGLGMCRGARGTLLFHTSLLVDLDVPLMLRLLAVPPEKLSDKLVRFVADRTTTLRRACQRPVLVDEARHALAAGYAAAFGVELVPQPFTPGERTAIERLVQSRYGTDAWVHHGRPEDSAATRQHARGALTGACFGPRSAATGHALRKTDAGLLRVYAALSGESIKSVLVTGDFFADAADVRRLEARLKWSHAERTAVVDAVAETGGSHGVVPELPNDDLVDTIWQAIEDARRRRKAA